jgi:hypothetical protein
MQGHGEQLHRRSNQRQHFGNQPGSFNDIEPDGPFVGAAKEYVFDCPPVDPAGTAILLFPSRDVSHSRNILQINGTQVYGRLPVSLPGTPGTAMCSSPNLVTSYERQATSCASKRATRVAGPAPISTTSSSITSSFSTKRWSCHSREYSTSDATARRVTARRQTSARSSPPVMP